MKKIVAVAAAMACAASMFAADISAATKINGKAFVLDENNKISVLSEGNDSHDYANPNFSMSVNGDKAGAQVKITTDGNTTLTTKMTTQTIWFKPVDMLKVTLGNYDVALNKETIDWTESFTGLGGNGYLCSLNVSGFALDLGLNEGNEGKFWLEKENEKDPAIKPFFVKAGYSADFGNIGAYVSFNKAKPADWEATKAFYYVDADATAALQSIDFGAGYKNTFAPITMFVNVVGHMEKTFEWVRPEVFVTGNVNGFGFNMFAAPVIWTNADLKQKTALEIVAKVTYQLGVVSPYVYFKVGNALAETFASTIKAGCTGSVGAMGWNTWLQLDTGKADNKVAISIPFEVSIGF